MKALVTGGAGFIGSHIVDSLLADEYRVISIDNYSAGKHENLSHINNSDFQEISCDVCDFDKLKQLMEGVDIVFHEAASKKNICIKDPRMDLDVNGKGTLNVLEAARECGVKKIVHASTGSVYGEPTVFPQTEQHPLNPNSYYGVSKLAGERYVAMYHKMGWINATILRYFHVYGPRQEDGEFGGVVAIFIRQAKNNEPLIIFGDGSQVRTFTYVDDIVKINRLSAGLSGGVYNCASGIKVTVNQLAGRILQLTKSDSKVEYKDWLTGDIKDFDVDNTEIKSLGIEFETDIDKGLRRAIDEVAVPC